MEPILSSHLYPVIMAGGAGTRFWPLSRKRRPKHILSINGPNSLLQDTVKRMEGLAPPGNILVVTNRQQHRIVAAQLRGLDDRNIILESSPRNTAPCVGLAAIHIRQRDPDGIMLVLPSDHIIRDVERFQRVVREGVQVAANYDALVTIGIPPTRPETGYGYIQFEPSLMDGTGALRRVKAFAEKPNRATAERFIQSGDFFWNSGIFIWQASRILAELEEHLPEQYSQLEHIAAALGSPEYDRTLSSFYNRIRPISIDYGVMEVTSTQIYVLNGDFGWSDVGSWDELYRITDKERDGNVTIGETVILDAKGCLIHSPNKLTAVIGIEDLLVINTAGITLICPMNRAQDVKQIVEKLRQEGKTQYL